MRSVLINKIILLSALVTGSSFGAIDTSFKHPPMGWNSYDCYGTSVKESEVIANANYMVSKLIKFGWNYVVIDGGWAKNYGGTPAWKTAHPAWIMNMDQYGRAIPDAVRFPSSSGLSFKALADTLHAKGLKFGIHLMRGIPRQAVTDNTPVLGTAYHAADIVDKTSTCPWSTDMWGIDMNKPGAQDYYNSLFQLYALWGVDFVKIDDLVRDTRTDGNEYHGAEMAGYRKAMDTTGRIFFFSTSPGPCSYPYRDSLAKYSNSWRMSDDLWDGWASVYNNNINDTTLSLLQHFIKWEKWFAYTSPGHWTDNDMLPLGRLSKRDAWYGVNNRNTRFTRDEQITVMTMSVITRSPLMFGGNLPDNTSFTDSLITNADVIAVNQNSENNRAVYSGVCPVWCANIPNSNDKYCGLFNTTDAPKTVSVRYRDLFLVSSSATVKDLWTGLSMGQVTDSFSTLVNAHGAGLYRITPVGTVPVADPARIRGTPFGIGPAYATGSEYTKAFDGDTSTSYNYFSSKEGFTGLDFGSDSIRRISVIKYYPRNTFESRMTGGKFQGSNTNMYSGYVDLHTITTVPAAGRWTDITLSSPAAYRYVRYLGADGTYSNIGEIQFYSNDRTGVKATAAKTISARTMQSTFRVTGRLFVVPKELSGSVKSILIFDMSGKCIHKSILNHDVIDLKKEFGLTGSVYLIQIKVLP